MVSGVVCLKVAPTAEGRRSYWSCLVSLLVTANFDWLSDSPSAPLVSGLLNAISRVFLVYASTHCSGFLSTFLTRSCLYRCTTSPSRCFDSRDPAPRFTQEVVAVALQIGLPFSASHVFTRGVKTDVSTRIGPNSIDSYQQGDVTRHVTPGLMHGLDACTCEEPMKWVYKMKPPFVVT